MRIEVVVDPMFVSFVGLYMAELPDESGSCPHGGYFNSPEYGLPWSHSSAVGAGAWLNVRSGNQWAVDYAGTLQTYPQPWSFGWKEWEIPVGWGTFDGEQYVTKGQCSPMPTTQRFEIDADGNVTIRKYSHWIKRSPDGRIWVDGIRVN